MSMVSSTVFELPSGRSAELRQLSGREEEWLSAHAEIPNASAVSRMLSQCLVGVDGASAGSGVVGRLLVGDRDFLVLQLRRMMLGDRIQAVLGCPACAAKIDVDFDAREAPVEWRLQKTDVHSIDLARAVQFRLPRGEDQEAVCHLPLPVAAQELFQRCLVDDGGTPLSGDERLAVIEEMERLAPKLEVELDLVCPECACEFNAPFDTTAFFFREIRSAARHLLREVHTLALHYHWSEAEILGLVRSRRRSYLELIGEAMRPN